MNEEMEFPYKNQTWDLAELPEDRRVVGCKWIFKKKSGLSSTEAIKYKARLVAKDYNEIFSMTVKHTSICVLQALTTTMDMELKQLDVKTTFLHGKLEEEILMKQLEGFEVQGKEDYVCRFKSVGQVVSIT